MANRVSLFVYGSFSEGMVHYRKISEYVKVSQPAWAKGRVYRLQVGYPVLVTDGDNRVEGQLLELEAPELLFKILDEFHGFSPISPEKSLYWKSDIKVQLEDGSERDALVYALNPSKLPKSAVLISDGRWKESLQSQPALTQGLSERQISYVKKLGSTTGRDIVPIDLDLYRELMKLDLIVDKGRRLALTKLGREVYRYLG